MSRERREQVMLYVMSITDVRKRAVAELYLARYPGFFLYGEGGMDFGLEERAVNDNGWNTDLEGGTLNRRDDERGWTLWDTVRRIFRGDVNKWK